MLIWSFIWTINGMSFSPLRTNERRVLEPPFPLQEPGSRFQIRKLANSICINLETKAGRKEAASSQRCQNEQRCRQMRNSPPIKQAVDGDLG